MTKHYDDINTELLHSCFDHDKETGALSIPIYQTSTFRQKDTTMSGPFDYSRSGNPTRQALEETVAAIEGGGTGLAFASGMAAIGSTLLLFSPGDHLIVTDDCYGGTFRILTHLLSRFKIEVSYCDTSDIDNIRARIKPNTKGIYIETPSNPLIKITDIKACADLAKSYNLVTIVDNTFMSPILQKPLTLGADIVVHSATKFIGGHSDVIAGLVIAGDDNLGKELRFIQNSFGAVLGPQDSWLLLRGLKTLGIRLDRQQETAQKLAEWLAEQPKITNVYYPGLSSNPRRETHFKQAKGPGSLISFETDTVETAERILNGLVICSLAVSLGAVETIVTYPKTMSHASVPRKIREERGLKDNLIRISVGLEGFADLRDDIAKGLK